MGNKQDRLYNCLTLLPGQHLQKAEQGELFQFKHSNFPSSEDKCRGTKKVRLQDTELGSWYEERSPQAQNQKLPDAEEKHPQSQG